MKIKTTQTITLFKILFGEDVKKLYFKHNETYRKEHT